MPGPSQTRFAAPAALVAAALAIYLVGFAGRGDDNAPAPPSQPAGRTAARAPSGAAKKAAGAKPARAGAGGPKATTGRTYTVKAGDVLSVISDETGVSITELERLNPGLDARALQVGRRLRLSG